jgi:diadenosine tetraphosphate (Ap4A) HIT family hydrolase
MPATWPSDWAERRRGTGCPMCGQGRPEENEYGVRVLAGRFSDAYLQRSSWQRGYTVVIWRGRHVAEPTELDEEEATGYWREVLRVGSALERHYQPVKLNYQILGERRAPPAHPPGAAVRRRPGPRPAAAVPGG